MTSLCDKAAVGECFALVLARKYIAFEKVFGAGAHPRLREIPFEENLTLCMFAQNIAYVPESRGAICFCLVSAIPTKQRRETEPSATTFVLNTLPLFNLRRPPSFSSPPGGAKPQHQPAGDHHRPLLKELLFATDLRTVPRACSGMQQPGVGRELP